MAFRFFNFFIILNVRLGCPSRVRAIVSLVHVALHCLLLLFDLETQMPGAALSGIRHFSFSQRKFRARLDVHAKCLRKHQFRNASPLNRNSLVARGSPQSSTATECSKSDIVPNRVLFGRESKNNDVARRTINSTETVYMGRECMLCVNSAARK